MAIADSVTGQFERSFGMLQAAIDLFPAHEWREGVDEYLVPARLAYHALETIDWYMGPGPEGFEWGHRFGVSWEDARSEQLPDQPEIRTYLNDIVAKSHGWLQRMDDERALGENVFHWTGRSPLEHAIYVLRHTQHHIAELNLELRRRGLPSADWR